MVSSVRCPKITNLSARTAGSTSIPNGVSFRFSGLRLTPDTCRWTLPSTSSASCNDYRRSAVQNHRQRYSTAMLNRTILSVLMPELWSPMSHHTSDTPRSTWRLSTTSSPCPKMYFKPIARSHLLTATSRNAAISGASLSTWDASQLRPPRLIAMRSIALPVPVGTTCKGLFRQAGPRSRRGPGCIPMAPSNSFARTAINRTIRDHSALRSCAVWS